MAFVTLALVLVPCLIAGVKSALAGGEREWPAAVRLAANGDPWPTIPERNAGSGSKAPGHAAVGRGEWEQAGPRRAAILMGGPPACRLAIRLAGVLTGKQSSLGSSLAECRLPPG